MKKLRIALAGNPNAGKSSLFNALTGSRQHVGNWPGKTVEKKQGSFIEGDFEVELVDLPGTYSLSAFSVEELVARDYILDEKPDAIVSVVDASNLERNLYLTVQLLELGVPVVVALNMSDLAKARGLHIDHAALGGLLGVTVVPTVASRGEGLTQLRQEILAMFDQVCEAGETSRNNPQAALTQSSLDLATPALLGNPEPANTGRISKEQL